MMYIYINVMCQGILCICIIYIFLLCLILFDHPAGDAQHGCLVEILISFSATDGDSLQHAGSSLCPQPVLPDVGLGGGRRALGSFQLLRPCCPGSEARTGRRWHGRPHLELPGAHEPLAMAGHLSRPLVYIIILYIYIYCRSHV